VRLPVKVKPETAEATYKNGVLDVTIQRAGSAGDVGKRVSIK
jgi:HSP20 family molecular chaperone IbpA